MASFVIRTATQKDTAVLADTIRTAFRDVAQRFGLTPENAPRHPSNCEEDWICSDMERGAMYFILETDGAIAGCVALEVANPDVCYLERLAVLPGRRRQGFGEALVAHVLSQASLRGAHRVSIGIIAAHAELKDWYGRLGFIEEETKGFSHLPFKVTFMSCNLDRER